MITQFYHIFSCVKYKYHYDNAISECLKYDTIKGVFGMIAERIAALREQRHLTQAELAKRLGVTRSSVNAWELGISVPSTQYLVELAVLFGVSTDFLLGVEATETVSVVGLTEQDVLTVTALIRHLREKNREGLQ